MMANNDTRPLIDDEIHGTHAIGNGLSAVERDTRAFAPVNGKTALPVTIAWRNVEATVTQDTPTGILSSFNCFRSNATETRTILNRVSGIVRPGHLHGIMGSSGSGKTTLLNVLMGRNVNRLSVTGDILINNVKSRASALGTVCSYIQQDDLFFANLTVKEHLIFQARLRLGGRYTSDELRDKVELIITELGLVNCANARIGNAKRKGISGGEKKRLAFGTELLTDPSLIVCDEPTSGLDSVRANSVVSVLKAQAALGKTVICTIHQPSSSTFALFDTIMLMSEGRVAFFGGIEDAKNMFALLRLPCPASYNPAEFFSECLMITPSKEVECRQRINAICQAFEATAKTRSDSTFYQHVNSSDSGQGTDPSEEPSVEYLSRQIDKPSYCTQVWALFWRAFLINTREQMIARVRLISTLITAIVLGIFYWHQQLNQVGIQNINGALFVILSYMSFTMCNTVLDTFCSEMTLVKREYEAGIYSSHTYFLTKTLAELPMFVLLPVMFSIVIYFMIGLNQTTDSFLTFVAIMVVVCDCTVSFGYLISTLCGNVTVAMTIVQPVMIVWRTVCGFLLNIKSIPFYLVWMKYLSWLYYGFMSLIMNQWETVTDIGCSNTTSSVLLLLPNDFSNRFGGGCKKTGNQVIDDLNFEHYNKYIGIACIVALSMAYRLIAFIFLFIRLRRSTH